MLATANDPRLTPVGALAAPASRLDEFPQLWNVLGGRDEPGGAAARAAGLRADATWSEVPGYASASCAPPGLTGLAQVNGDYHSTPENKLRYDLAYIANWSLWLDLSILLRTVRIVLTSRGL